MKTILILKEIYNEKPPIDIISKCATNFINGTNNVELYKDVDNIIFIEENGSKHIFIKVTGRYVEFLIDFETFMYDIFK